jgi:serine protease inhibitor
MVLAMLELGAGGQTKRQLDRALCVAKPSVLPDLVAARVGEWSTSSEPKIHVANSVWLRAGLPIEPSYADTLTSRFDATASELLPDDEAAREAVNAWVSARTHEHIPTLLAEPPDPLTVAILVSALYFEGKWAQPFDPVSTGPSTFVRDDGVALEVPTMFEYLSVRWAFDGGEDPGYAAVELPYAGSLDLDMLLIQPPKGTSLADGFTALEFDRLVALLDTLESQPPPEQAQPVLVGLPRFTVSSRCSMLEPLHRLGVHDAFDSDAANFRGITSTDVHVSAFEHAVALRVDEAGTVGAAAAAASLGSRSAPPRLIFDRPFWYVIRQRSGPWLFVGQVADPLAAV